MKIRSATWLLAPIGALLLAVCVWFQLKPTASTGGDTPLSTSREHSGPRDAPVTATDEAQLEGSSVESTVVESSWSSRYERAHNLAHFVKEASEAATQGDATAAWYINEALAQCLRVVSSVRKPKDTEVVYVSVEGTTETADERAKRYQRCRELGVDEYFADWELTRDGKMNPQYWRDIALTLGSPVAKADTVIREGSALRILVPTERQKKVAELRGFAKEVIRSQDAEALFALGMWLANEDISKDTSYGWALALAACDLGYDCSARNKKNSWSNCNGSGACPADQTLREVVEGMLSPEQYAAAHALAEQFKDGSQRGLFSELDRFVALDGSEFQSR